MSINPQAIAAGPSPAHAQSKTASARRERSSFELAAAALIALLVLAGAACTQEDDTARPPALPLIFAGKLTVNGQPGPAGVKIFAQVGKAQSPVADTFAGTYRNIILGPNEPADQKGDITFYLGEPGGKTIKAKETYRFRMVGEPTVVELDLSFPGLP